MPSEARGSQPDPSHATRARGLLARMTRDEKLAQVAGVWATSLHDGAAFSSERARAAIPHGIGHLTRVGAALALPPVESARFANAAQRWLREETRLGIPAVVHEESCAGYVGRDATCFPQAIGLAASFDPALVEEMARVIRAQMRAVGAHHTLAPVLDVARDPRWGRMEETFGEDPWLVAQIGVAYVRGIQGGDLRRGVVATGKHFVGYGASEGGLNWAPAHLGWREILDVHAFPFEAAIREAGLASMMNAYHELDGVPCGASEELLHDLLRERLGFTGTLVSDYFTVATLASYHRVAASKGEAAALALRAGIDVELPAADCYGAPLREALAQGAVPEALLDRAVLRVLEQKLALGLFDDPFVDETAATTVFDTAPQRALARQLVQRSCVLLRNEGGLLPIDPATATVAVIGPSAASARLLQGDYHYPTHLEIVFGAMDEGDLSPRPAGAKPNLALQLPPTVTILDGIRAAVASGTRVLHAAGCETTGASRDGFAEAVAAAREADVAILVLGGRSGLVDGCTSGESVDRSALGLPGVQQALADAVLDTGTPAVVVLVDGRPLALPELAARAPALLHAWLPGEQGGSGVADVLFGRADPGGRLPVSMPAGTGQLPVFHGHKPSGGRSQWKGSYVDGPVSPLFPFGHGLSYGRYAYGALHVTPECVNPDDVLEISCEVVNEGARAGEEVVQLYVRDLVGSVSRPVRELRGFHRVALAPGEGRRVVFRLPAAALAFHGADRRLVLEPGEHEVVVGASATDVRLTGRFAVLGERAHAVARRAFRCAASDGPLAG